MLFRVEFHPSQELEDQAQEYLEDMENASQKAKTEIQEKYQNILSHISEIDSLIGEKSKGWELSRLAKADITVLRLAAYEIMFDTDVPNSVAINEAVELSKTYGTDKSAAFINGVLASVAKEYPEETNKEDQSED